MEKLKAYLTAYIREWEVTLFDLFNDHPFISVFDTEEEKELNENDFDVEVV